MSAKLKIIGREAEWDLLQRALPLGRNVLIEGPVGVGKTFLVTEILRKAKRGYERVDGDTRYTEQKLTGWFDPPSVLKKGYTADCFLDGPLTAAMKEGKVLFINELNRMPEAVQNILLPAMDERRITLPKLGEVSAKDGFLVIATQNPREFTATHALSEALLDRFEMIRLDYQTREEEWEIARQQVAPSVKKDVIDRAIELVRATREHSAIKRGASVRAAIAIGKLVEGGLGFMDACLMALPSRMEMVSAEDDPREVIRALLANGTLPGMGEKKGPSALSQAGPTTPSKFAPVFLPPELAVQTEMDSFEGLGLGVKTDRMRTLYFQRARGAPTEPGSDSQLVSLVLDHAKKVIAHPSRPMVRRLESFVRHPFGELALEESLEESPVLSDAEDFLVELPEEKPFTCVMILDCSSSMSGEKHLLASISVAVLLLEVRPRDSSLVVFASEASSIKRLQSEEAVEATLLRFLKASPRGFTNIHRGLDEGLKQFRAASAGKRKVALLATDGRTTEGGDPLALAREFDFLVVLHLHGPGSHLEASQQMAQAGHGVCLEVERFEELPHRLYDALRLLARL